MKGWGAVRLALLCVVGLARAQASAAQTEVAEYCGVDAVGSIRVVFLADGSVIGRADYAPFGEAVASTTGQLPAIQFTGQERDPEAAQDYFHARYYQPRHGRLGSVDPVFGNLFDPQQLNRYAYARNSPATFVDPTGEYTRDANAPGGYSCAEILKDNPGDALCNPSRASSNVSTSTLVSGVRVDVMEFRVGRGDQPQDGRSFADENRVFVTGADASVGVLAGLEEQKGRIYSDVSLAEMPAIIADALFGGDQGRPFTTSSTLVGLGIPNGLSSVFGVYRTSSAVYGESFSFDVSLGPIGASYVFGTEGALRQPLA